MYTGEGDYTKVRNYLSAYGNSNITVPIVGFNGNTSTLTFINPYINSTPILGNDGAFTRPNLD